MKSTNLKSFLLFIGALLSSTFVYSQPGNDNCANAINLISNTNCNYTAGTTVGATQSIVATPCGGTCADDVWYKFTAVAATHTVKVQSSSSFDAVVDVRSGSCNGTNITCKNATVIAGLETLNLSGLTVSNTYYVRIYGFDIGCAFAPFQICVTHSAATDIAFLKEELPITLFPIPSTGILNITQLQASNSEFTLALYDRVGKQVKQFSIVGNLTQPYTISIDDLPAGMYFYTITYANGKAARGKVVKE